MSTPFFVLIVFFVLAAGVGGVGVFLSRGNRVVRLALAALLVPVGLFCGFGFLASFEPSKDGGHFLWMIGYAGLGLACLVSVILLVSRRKSGFDRVVDASDQ